MLSGAAILLAYLSGGKPTVFRELRILESSSGASVRLNAVYALMGAIEPMTGAADVTRSDFDDDRIMSRFQAVMAKEDDDKVKESLAQLFLLIGDKRFTSSLWTSLERTRTEPARREIIKTLAGLGDQRSMPHLVQYLRSGDAASVEIATFGFGRFRNDETTRYLIESLGRPNTQIGLSQTVGELSGRQAGGAVPALKKLMLTKDEGVGLNVIPGLLNLDRGYAREILAKGDDPFSMNILAGSLSIASSGDFSIARLEGMAMDKKEDIRVRKNILVALRSGRYWNVNYVRWLYSEQYEKKFLEFLRATAADSGENRLLREECRRILAIPQPT